MLYRWRHRYETFGINACIDDVWEIDPADLSSFSKYDRYKFLLNVIDIFSRYAWCVPLKDKIGTSINQLRNLFQNRKPITTQSDKGSKFVDALSSIT